VIRFIDSLTPVVGNDGREETGNLLVALAQDIFVVEPDAFLIVELGAAL
jgi:hypothetical protein